MDKAIFIPELRIGSIENLMLLKKFSNGGSTPTYEDRTASGNPVIFTTNFAQNAKALSVEFAPKQNLNGYDRPWAGGTGKNLVGAGDLRFGYTLNTQGIVATYVENRCATFYKIPVDNTKTYVFSTASSDVNMLYCVYNGSTFVRRVAGVAPGRTLNLTGGNYIRLCFYTALGEEYDYRKVDLIGDKVQVEASSTPTSFEPYENICPITGMDSIDVVANSVTHEFDLGRTVYGGTLNATTGILMVTDALIESYNGETLPSTWISDRDEYRAGATPTIGAQVVYKLATPLTYQLTPQQIALLEGENVIATDADNLNLTYQVKV